MKQTLTRMRDGAPGPYPGMDLAAPTISWPELARGFGIAGVRIDSADELASLLAGRVDPSEPLLIEIPIRPFGAG